MSADSIVPGAANSQAYDRYSYVMNSPLIYTDPSGHMRSDEDPTKRGSVNIPRAPKPYEPPTWTPSKPRPKLDPIEPMPVPDFDPLDFSYFLNNYDEFFFLPHTDGTTISGKDNDEGYYYVPMKIILYKDFDWLNIGINVLGMCGDAVVLFAPEATAVTDVIEIIGFAPTSDSNYLDLEVMLIGKLVPGFGSFFNLADIIYEINEHTITIDERRPKIK